MARMDTCEMDWEVAAFYIEDDSSGVVAFNLSSRDEAEYLARCYVAEHNLNGAQIKVDRKASCVLIIVH